MLFPLLASGCYFPLKQYVKKPINDFRNIFVKAINKNTFHTGRLAGLSGMVVAVMVVMIMTVIIMMSSFFLPGSTFLRSSVARSDLVPVVQGGAELDQSVLES